MDIKTLSESVFSFVGDAVYSLLTRERLALVNRPSGELHEMNVKAVNANAQQRAYTLIENMLTEEEKAVFKRGRNFHTNNVPKSSNAAAYHTATGVETLFGYLHLKGEKGRIDELFSVIWEDLIKE